MCIRRPMRQWLKGMHEWNLLDVPGVAKSGQAGNGQGRKWTRAGSGQGPSRERHSDTCLGWGRWTMERLKGMHA